MQDQFLRFGPRDVALRKESVDRNDMAPYMVARFKMSLSARRAWIEMTLLELTSSVNMVALRKESVDRNTRNLPEAFRP